jgi:hypothetical protein
MKENIKNRIEKKRPRLMLFKGIERRRGGSGKRRIRT